MVQKSLELWSSALLVAIQNLGLCICIILHKASSQRICKPPPYVRHPEPTDREKREVNLQMTAPVTNRQPSRPYLLDCCTKKGCTSRDIHASYLMHWCQCRLPSGLPRKFMSCLVLP